MSEHQPSCVRSQFWDAGEYDAPCTCDTKEQEAGVTDGLIARLKAAHEAATPGPWFDSPVRALPGCHTIRQGGLNRPVARMTIDEVCVADVGHRVGQGVEVGDV